MRIKGVLVWKVASHDSAAAKAKEGYFVVQEVTWENNRLPKKKWMPC